MKRVVVCCDGTWNVADPADGSPTNVVKFALNVAPVGRGVVQRVSYDPGVGTGTGDRLRGGAFGFGLSRNVREAYRFLAETVEDDDEIYLVGFSRGAFTVRSVAGLVENCGLLRRENADRVDEAYRIYRSRRDDDEPGGIAAELFRRTYARRVPIRFLGVFDTVGALGIPFSGGRLGRMVNGWWAFHRTDLGPSVENAFQALAIDERRRPYEPALWTEARASGHVEQVWFRGAHSDVGGGQQDPDLADITLRWMVGRARWCGLAFDRDSFEPACSDPGRTPTDRARGVWTCPDPAGTITDSARRWWVPGSTTVRRLGRNPGEGVAAVVPQHPAPLPIGFGHVSDDRFVDIGDPAPEPRLRA